MYSLHLKPSYHSTTTTTTTSPPPPRTTTTTTTTHPFSLCDGSSIDPFDLIKEAILPRLLLIVPVVGLPLSYTIIKGDTMGLGKRRRRSGSGRRRRKGRRTSVTLWLTHVKVTAPETKANIVD